MDIRKISIVPRRRDFFTSFYYIIHDIPIGVRSLIWYKGLSGTSATIRYRLTLCRMYNADYSINT